MSQQLQFYTLFRRLFWWVLALLVIVELLIFRMHLHEFSTKPWLIAVGQFLLLSTVPLSLIFRLLFFIRPKVFKTYSLDETTLRIGTGQKQQVVLLTDIVSIRPSRWPQRWGGGFTLNLKSGQRFSISSFIRDSYQIYLAAIKTNSQLATGAWVEKFRKKSICLGLVWQRYRWRLKFWPLLVVRVVLIPVGLASLLMTQELIALGELGQFDRWLIHFTPIFLINLLLVFLLSTLEDLLLNRNYNESVNPKDFIQRPLERNSYYVVSVVHLALVGAVAFLLL